MDNFDDKTNAIIADDEPAANGLLSEKDNKKINEATTPTDKKLDDVPSANEQGRDTNSNKKLKTLAIFIGAILVAIAGIVMASSRYSENKAQRKAQEAENIAKEQKKMATGSVNIADDQQKIQNNKLYDIPPPADANTNDVDTLVTPVQTVEDDTYTPPPPPVPKSHYESDSSMVAYRDYSPPAPIQNQVSEPVVEQKPQIQAPPPPAGVLVDVYGTKTVTQTSSQLVNDKGIEVAKRRGDTSLLLMKGTNIPCVLKTKIDSTYQGFTVCQVSKDVYSANGKVLLIERGSSVFGEQNVQIQHGMARVYVIWQRIETPKGVSVNVDSPATGQLGEMGVGARVNNHFFQRFGGAIMLSLIQDVIAAGTTHLQKQPDGEQTVINNTSGAAGGIAEKALENSINIPPTAIVHQGTLINILAVRDVDFSGVYGAERVY